MFCKCFDIYDKLEGRRKCNVKPLCNRRRDWISLIIPEWTQHSLPLKHTVLTATKNSKQAMSTRIGEIHASRFCSKFCYLWWNIGKTTICCSKQKARDIGFWHFFANDSELYCSCHAKSHIWIRTMSSSPHLPDLMLRVFTFLYNLTQFISCRIMMMN